MLFSVTVSLLESGDERKKLTDHHGRMCGLESDCVEKTSETEQTKGQSRNRRRRETLGGGGETKKGESGKKKRNAYAFFLLSYSRYVRFHAIHLCVLK